MSALSPEEGRAASDHFRRWLRIGTGCGFASHLAGRGLIGYQVHGDLPAPDELDQSLDHHASRDAVAVLIFPFILGEPGLVELLSSLPRGSPRWTLHRRASDAGVLHVGLEWQTSADDKSDAMGFAPLPSMPVPRRSPYFAIALWPGGRSNPHRGRGRTPPGRPGHVSFLDAAHDIGLDDSDALYDATEHAVADLMTLPPDNARLYRRVAFVLDERIAGPLVPPPAEV